MKILLVDDEKYCLEDLYYLLSQFSYEVDKTEDPQEALKMLEQNNYDLLISDVNMPFMDGFELKDKALSLKKAPKVILISGKEDVIESINSMQQGVFDFLTKPVVFEELFELVQKVEKDENADALQKYYSPSKLPDKVCIDEFLSLQKESSKIGIFSSKMKEIYRKLKKLQSYPEIPVLIAGETGAGKEVIAQFLHYQNPNVSGPFVAVNCPVLDGELFNSELFGYEKGAFTGADNKGRVGKIKLAQNGTLFLDEITEISLASQAKLLRLLQEREYYPVGSNKIEKLNTRIICSSNRNLEEAVVKGLFREDLFYRLNVCKINLPSLKERREEIIPLTLFFLGHLSSSMGKKLRFVKKSVLELFYNHDWRGNIRELKNLLTGILLFHDSELLSVKDIEGHLLSSKPVFNKEESFNKLENQTDFNKIDITHFELPQTPFNLEAFSLEIVKKALEKFEGNKTKAADFLGLTRNQLYRRYKV